MTDRRATFRWPPAPAAAPGTELALGESLRGERRPLAERLTPSALDRVAWGPQLVAEASGIVAEWVAERRAPWPYARAAAELEAGLAPWAAAHGWRGPAALLLDALRGAFRRAQELGQPDPRPALLEELAQWQLGDDEASPEEGRGRAAGGAWDGTPLGPGRRLAPRAAIAAQAALDFAAGELVLVAAPSDAVRAALAAARRRGLDPEALVGLGGPTRAGCAFARELAADGVRVRVAADAALGGLLARADRAWLGTEAIGAGAFLAPVGTRALLEEARRREVPVEGLAARDAVVPGGRAEPPHRPDEDGALLWCDPPEGVALESRPYEQVELELVDAWWTELGRESSRALVLRALRAEPEPALASPGA